MSAHAGCGATLVHTRWRFLAKRALANGEMLAFDDAKTVDLSAGTLPTSTRCIAS